VNENGVIMKKKDLVELYNKYLSNELRTYQIKTWDDLSKLSLKDLQKMIDFFSGLLLEAGLDGKGEVTTKGAVIDDIISQINIRMIRLKEKEK